jgi:hypothetical protein
VKLSDTIVTLLTLFLVAGVVNCRQAAEAQTASDIENIVRSSKWVDKSRPVRAFINSKLVTISTYCDSQDSDQNCKINSLFIMKELLNRYKTIHRMRISFFNPKISNAFRSLEVTEGDVVLIDSGKPAQQVLSQIQITHGILPGSSSAKASSTSESGAANSKMNAYYEERKKAVHRAESDFNVKLKGTADQLKKLETDIRGSLGL